MTSRLLFVGVLGLVCGIAFQILRDAPWQVVVGIGVLGLACGALFCIGKKHSYAYAALFFLLACLGAFRVYVVPDQLPIEYQSLLNTDVSVEGIVVAEPDTRETTQRLTIRIDGEEDTKVLVVAPLYPPVSYGERVRVAGELQEPEPFDTTEGRVFRYDQFLAKDGIFAIIPQASVEVLAPREGVTSHMLGFFTDVKKAGLTALSHALPEPHASLAGGLILGGKQGLGKELLDEFIVVGLIHIVVLSGYNVMIVAEFVLRVFGFLSRRSAVIAALVTISAFVLAAGAGAASIRAGIMAAVALFARASGRTYDAFRALVAAGVVMLLVNPLILIYDPGFQLSFIATLGLIFGAPMVEEKLSIIKSDFLREIVSATIAAQIAVLPLLLYQNGLFSIVALPANVLVLPIVPFAMLFSFFALLVGLVAPVIAPVFGLPAHALLSYIIGIVEVSAALPFAAFSLPAFPFVFVILSYTLLGWLAYRYGR